MRRWIHFVAISLSVAVAAAYIPAISSGRRAEARGEQSDQAARGTLPRLGTRLTPLPEGPGKQIAEVSCLPCHASDIIRQQRLTRQQWTGTLTKMANWGADIPEAQRETLLEYLASHFGPENASFQPVVARPVGR